jgi:hypothetical protein
MAQAIFSDIFKNAIPVAKRVNYLALTGGTARTWTVPSHCECAVVYFDAGTLYQKDVTADNPGAAAAPAGDLADGTGSEKVLDGSIHRYDESDTVSFFNAVSCTVVICMFARG